VVSCNLRTVPRSQIWDKHVDVLMQGLPNMLESQISTQFSRIVVLLQLWFVTFTFIVEVRTTAGKKRYAIPAVPTLIT